MQSEVAGVDYGAFGCVDDEPIGTRHGMIYVDRFNFDGFYFHLVASMKSSELESFHVIVEAFRADFVEGLKYDCSCFSAVDWNLPIEKGDVS